MDTPTTAPRDQGVRAASPGAASGSEGAPDPAGLAAQARALDERLARALALRGVEAAPGEGLPGALVTDRLLEAGRLDGQTVNEVLQEVLGVRAMDPSLAPFDPEFLRQAGKLVTRREALEALAFPIRLEGGQAHVVMARPDDEALRRRLEHLFCARVAPYACHARGIHKAVEAGFPEVREDAPSPDVAVQAARAAKALARQAPGARGRDPSEEAEVAALLRALLDDMAGPARGGRASDIHLEPGERAYRVRCRVDGIMRTGHELPPAVGRALSRRVKALSGMDPDPAPQPRDGSIASNLVDGRPLDMRVSALPALHGEKLVLRLLDKGGAGLSLEDLGLPPRDLEVFTKAIDAPGGLVLVTGPTGSGKTTTLYAALGRLNTPRVNILTAEDPVEYRLEGVTQTPCPGGEGLTFAQALRAFLRQDPDIVMVGEIRDLETADTAVKAAMTGHLVLSTLHTNDAPGAVSRLVHMGVPAHLVAGARLTVAAQRLLRRVCPDCARETDPPRGLPGLETPPPGAVFRRGAGCAACRGSGYRGRVGVYEVFRVDEAMERLILEGAPDAAIRRAAEASGMTTLRRAALERLARGLTTAEEVLRVTLEA